MFGNIKKSLISLAFGTFGLGMAEFVMMGILPDVAKTMNISIPSAGHFISAYALGVAFGAIVLVFAARKKPLKNILLALVSIHIIGNLLTAITPNYFSMLITRFISGLPHGGFFGIGSIVAGKIADKGKGSQAVATMVAGMTVANLMGIPLGTFISHNISWRVLFLLIGIFGIFVFMFISKWVPRFDAMPDNGILGQFKFLKSLAPWLIIGAIMLGNGGIFCWLSYINPLLVKVSGFKPQYVSLLMIIAGAGMCVGNFVGGKLSDRLTPAKVAGYTQLVAALTLVLIFFLSGNSLISVGLMFVCTACLFAISAPQQVLIIENAPGGEILGAASAQMAFNLGNALGAFCGGLPVEFGLGYQFTTVPGAVFAFVGFLLFMYFIKRYDRTKHISTEQEISQQTECSLS